MDQFDLSDEEWSIIESHFPKAGRGPARQDDHRIRIVEHIFPWLGINRRMSKSVLHSE